MSVIKVNNITNRDGTTGPVIAGIATVSSTSHLVVPTGRTGQRYVDGGENIVRDGLVLYLDAKYSYPSTVGIGTTTAGASATPGSSVDGEPFTWYDISGNENNGQLVNQVGFNTANGGSLVFDGVNDYVECSPYTTLSSATFIVWMRRNGTPNSTAGIFLSRTSGGEGLNFNGLNVGYHWNGAANTYSWDSGLTTPDLTWCMVAVSVSPSLATAYLGQSSGITTAVNNVSHSPTTINSIRVGGDASFPTTRSYPGNIAIAQIYNRALTAAEVSQNFNALKSRFGL